jgi:methionine-rich copper-binding protein CopC
MPFMHNPGMFSKRILLVVLLLVAVFAYPLLAQIKVERTEPAANSIGSIMPNQIVVWFTQGTTLRLAKMNLMGPSGVIKLAAPVIDGNSLSATIVGTLSDGTYVASWQAMGENGRLQRGQFRFTVRTK